MAEIGAILREARVRARIEISEIEAATKIRTKYLRALENDDWEVLPGAAYTRSFMRAYAEVVGIDPTPLLEEYRLHHQPASEYEPEYEKSSAAKRPRVAGGSRARPAAQGGDRGRRARGGAGRGGGRGRRVSRRAVVIALALALLVIALIGLATSGGKGGGQDTRSGNIVTPATGTDATTTTTTSSSKARSVKPVSIQVVPTQPVRVCLVSASGRRILDGVTLQPGTDQPAYRSKRFEVSFGPGGAQLIAGAKTYRVPAAGAGYVVTADGRRKLNRSDWPTCGV